MSFLILPDRSFQRVVEINLLLGTPARVELLNRHAAVGKSLPHSPNAFDLPWICPLALQPSQNSAPVVAEVDAECDQLFRIGNIAHGFDGANSHVDLVQEFGRYRRLHPVRASNSNFAREAADHVSVEGSEHRL